jgi:hypothetical protein
MWYPNVAGASVITEPQAGAQVAVGAKNVTRVSFHFCIDRATYFEVTGFRSSSAAQRCLMIRRTTQILGDRCRPSVDTFRG